MDIEIELYNSMGAGCTSRITGRRGDVELHHFKHSKNTAEMCAKAAQILRRLAARFDALAKEPDAFKEAVQNRINKEG